MVDMQVNFPAMAQANGDFRDAEDANARSKSSLDGTVQGLSSSWTGDAQKGFRDVMDAWGAEFAKVQQALNRLTTTLEGNLQGYQTNEQNQVQASSPITNALSSAPQARV